MTIRPIPPAVREAPFPHDPGFPELPVASDPERMRELLRTRLTPAPGKSWGIGACTPTRFRCRQSGARCVLQYEFRLTGPGAADRKQWVTGVLYEERGRAERLWWELQRSHPRRGIPDEWLTFEPVAFIPELNMLVQVFPWDRKLPTLRRILRGDLQEFEPLLLGRPGRGGGIVAARHIEPARYRTELGATLEYTVRTAEPSPRRCYLKVYRNDRGRDSYRLLRSLARRAHRLKAPFSVVHPVLYLSGLRTLVLEPAPGISLQQALLRGDDPADAVRPVAHAVAAFNRGTVPLARRHSLTSQLEDVRRAATLVQWACPQTAADVGAITADLVAGLQEVPDAAIHRDLKTDHVFLADGRVIFIDLDSVALGDPVRDPAHLWAHLAGRIGLAGLVPERANAAAAAFAEEYFALVPAAWRERFPMHCAGALIEVAGGVFKRQEQGWRETIPQLVERAARAVGGILE